MSQPDSVSKQEREPLTYHDGFIAVFYLIIIFVGVLLCLSRGKNASLSHLIAVSISIWGVLVFKLAKYKSCLKKHAGDLVFVGFLCAVALFALITALI